ncbi:MAG: hypothetical protein M1401_07735 [Chloroflexi bacterium]|nr:hypothetical protein [Chloroflexota bacterium]
MQTTARPALALGRRELRLSDLWPLLPPIMAFTGSALSSIPLSDFWWHLRFGQRIWTERWLGTVDDFSFTTPGVFAPTIQWLGDLYIFFCYSLGGIEMVLVGKAIALSLVAWLMYKTARLLGVGRLAGAAFPVIATYVCVLRNGDLRPQLLGYAMFALWYYWLVRIRVGRRAPLWLIFPVAILWANTNGTLIVGGALLAGTVVAEAFQARMAGRLGPTLPKRGLWAMGAATASLPIAMAINPWGVDLYRYLSFYAFDATARARISEWRPPTTDSEWGTAFFAFLLVGVALLSLAPRRPTLTEMALFLVYAGLAIQSARNLVWFGIVAAPLMAAQAQSLATLWPKSDSAGETRWLNWTFAAVLLLLPIISLPWWRWAVPMPADQRLLYDKATPVQGIAYAASHYAGERFFHPYSYGGYMIWGAYGKLKVFVDGRYNHYVPEVMDDYLAICDADGWQDRLRKYTIRHVMIAKNYDPMKPLLRQIRQSSDWRLEYEDDNTLLFVNYSP